MPGGLPSNSRARNLREAHSSIWSRNRRNCSSRSFGAVRVTCSRLSIADVLTAQGMSFVPSVMENRNTMRSNSKPLMLPRSSLIYLAFSRATSLYSSSFRRLRINLREFAKTVGSEACGGRTKVPLIFVEYQPEMTPRRSASSVCTWRGERFCMGCFQFGRSIQF